MVENIEFEHYTVDYIGGVMSLRDPQKKSLEILDKIYTEVLKDRISDRESALEKIHNLYPICTDFERDFISLTFSLATGVGKTRLMGAFITYLYTNHGIRNFFIVAPNITVYDKLEQDFSNASSPKYVFKGLGCFSNPPYIISSDDYRDKQLNLFSEDINIFMFNIDKFNKESSNMHSLNEYFGSSFFDVLSNLEDLVVLMDESHHYRAKSGMKALNDLKPFLGLELTATPLVKSGAKQIKFKNVVYEYPLSQAIANGYTRTPFAFTRSESKHYQFGDEEMDKLKLNDGIICHESIKQELKEYANETGQKIVKPFMMVVCTNTEHATWVEQYMKSNDFRNGEYANKVIMVHSKMRGVESDQNMRLLLDVERVDNPVEIVIHVNMLKEGWDVNNLYTIVPLRTAASKILREQMVGRGLRLPYGKRTGNRKIDAVMLAAHENFDDILEEARKGDSIFNAGNVIYVEDIENEKNEYQQMNFDLEEEKELAETYEVIGLEKTEKNDQMIYAMHDRVKEDVMSYFQRTGDTKLSDSVKKDIVENVKVKMITEQDYAEIFMENQAPIIKALNAKVDKVHHAAAKKFIHLCGWVLSN